MSRLRIHWNVVVRVLVAVGLISVALSMTRYGVGWRWLPAALAGIAVGIAQGSDTWWHLEKRP